MNNNKIYKIGIIGYGGMADTHRKQLENSSVRAKVYGVYDISPVRMEEAKNLGLVTYDSPDTLLADENIDIVLVATTNEYHKKFSIDALRAGKHVICEKPVTTTSAELEEIMETANRYNKVFTVNQNRRFNRDFISMWRNVDSGIIGKPYIIDSRVEGSRGIPEGWRTNKKQGGGMMYDWGVHLIDQMLYMNKSRIASVFCKMYNVNYSDVDDNFRLIITFENGLDVYIEISTNSYIRHERFYVLGTEGSMSVNRWNGTGKIVRKVAEDNKWETEIAKTDAGPSKTMADRNPKTIEEIEIFEPTDVRDNLEPVYEQFIDAIEGSELLIKPEEALRVLKVIEAAFESAEKGIAIKTNI